MPLLFGDIGVVSIGCECTRWTLEERASSVLAANTSESRERKPRGSWMSLRRAMTVQTQTEESIESLRVMKSIDSITHHTNRPRKTQSCETSRLA